MHVHTKGREAARRRGCVAKSLAKNTAVSFPLISGMKASYTKVSIGQIIILLGNKTNVISIVKLFYAEGKTYMSREVYPANNIAHQQYP